MDKNLEKEFREKLLEEKKKVEEDLLAVAKRDPNTKDEWDAKFPNYGDMNSNNDESSDEVEEYVANIAIEETLEERIKDINSALAKIDEGVYGKCEKCEGDISLERLKVNPEARLCIGCAG